MKPTIEGVRIVWTALWILQVVLGDAVPAMAQRRKTEPESNTQFQQDVQGQQSTSGGPIPSGSISVTPGAGGAAASALSVQGVQIGSEPAEQAPAPGPSDPMEVRITVRAKDVSLATFLETISAQAKVNFIISEGLERKRMTAFLQGVTVRDSLDLMLQMKGLTYTRIGKTKATYLISPRSSRAPNRITRIYTLSYISLVPLNNQTSPSPGGLAGGSSGISGISMPSASGAGTVAGAGASPDSGIGIIGVLKSVLTKEGSVQVDPRTNSMIVTDISEVFPNVEQIIAELDKKPPQIMIEAQIVEINSDRAQQLGLEWGGANGELASFHGGARDTTFPLNLPNNLSHFHFFDQLTNVQSSLGSSAASGTSGTTATSGGTVNATNPFQSLVIGSTLESGVLSLASLQVILRALVTRTEARFLGKPKILTLNNKTAVIQISQDQAIGAQSTATQLGGGNSGATSTVSAERKPTGLLLRVTPQVNKEGYITMLVEPSFVDIVQSQVGTPSSPIFDPVNRSASTMVRVKNGQTLVLGGLLSSRENKLVRKVPFLGYIPLIGWLFTSTSSQRSNTDLVIFITPTVVND